MSTTSNQYIRNDNQVIPTVKSVYFSSCSHSKPADAGHQSGPSSKYQDNNEIQDILIQNMPPRVIQSLSHQYDSVQNVVPVLPGQQVNQNQLSSGAGYDAQTVPQQPGMLPSQWSDSGGNLAGSGANLSGPSQQSTSSHAGRITSQPEHQ